MRDETDTKNERPTEHAEREANSATQPCSFYRFVDALKKKIYIYFHCQDGNGHHRRPLEERRHRLEVGALSVASFYAVITLLMWIAMVCANKISQEQFRLSNRPWIGLVANTPVQIDRQYIRTDGTTEFVGKFNIQNYGTSVAVNAITLGNGMNIEPEAACRSFGGMEQTCSAGQKFATGEVPRIPPSHEKLGIVLFPNQVAIAVLDLAADLGAKRPVNVAITGCVVYVDQRKELHETRFCVEAMFDGQRFEPWISCNVCNEAK